MVGCVALVQVYAQGNLQFNQALIIAGSTPQTVPDGKVWKITSVYGTEFVLNQCVSNAPANNWLGLRCISQLQGSEGGRSAMVSYFTTQLLVNGTRVVSELTGLGTQTLWDNATCASSSWTNQNLACANRTTNPNMLPMWLPENTTVATNAATVFASVLEFNVVP